MWILLQLRSNRCQVMKLLLMHTVGRGGLVVGTSHSQSRESGFESFCCSLGNFVLSTLPQFTRLYK